MSRLCNLPMNMCNKKTPVPIEIKGREYISRVATRIDLHLCAHPLLSAVKGLPFRLIIGDYKSGTPTCANRIAPDCDSLNNRPVGLSSVIVLLCVDLFYVKWYFTTSQNKCKLFLKIFLIDKILQQYSLSYFPKNRNTLFAWKYVLWMYLAIVNRSAILSAAAASVIYSAATTILWIWNSTALNVVRNTSFLILN